MVVKRPDVVCTCFTGLDALHLGDLFSVYNYIQRTVPLLEEAALVGQQMHAAVETLAKNAVWHEQVGIHH